MKLHRLHRKYKCPRPMKPGARFALITEDEVRQAAARHGITLVVTIPQSARGTKMVHQMFNNRHGSRLLNHWPSTGTVWIDGSRGTALDEFHALRMAVAIAEGMPPAEAINIMPEECEEMAVAA